MSWTIPYIIFSLLQSVTYTVEDTKVVIESILNNYDSIVLLHLGRERQIPYQSIT